MNLDEAYWTLTRQVVALGERIITIPKEIAALESERQTCIEERSRINSQIQAINTAKAIIEFLTTESPA